MAIENLFMATKGTNPLNPSFFISRLCCCFFFFDQVWKKERERGWYIERKKEVIWVFFFLFFNIIFHFFGVVLDFGGMWGSRPWGCLYVGVVILACNGKRGGWLVAVKLWLTRFILITGIMISYHEQIILMHCFSISPSSVTLALWLHSFYFFLLISKKIVPFLPLHLDKELYVIVTIFVQ